MLRRGFLIKIVLNLKRTLFHTSAVTAPSVQRNDVVLTSQCSDRRTDRRNYDGMSTGPVVWNSLPAAVREADSLHSFRRKLKTHRFTLCFNDWL